MTARTHDILAFGSLMTVATFFPPETLKITTVLVSIIGNIVGSLLPDIDQASNRLWDLLPGGNIIGRLLKNLFIAHRTLSHSILGVALVYGLLVWLMPRVLNSAYIDTGIVIVAIMIGYLSHLLADGLTEEGLPLLFPLKIKFGFPPIKKWRMHTGGWWENLVVFPGVIGYIVWFGYNQHDKLIMLIKLIK